MWTCKTLLPFMNFSGSHLNSLLIAKQMNVSETDMPLSYQNESTVSKEFKIFKFIANWLCVQRRKMAQNVAIELHRSQIKHEWQSMFGILIFILKAKRSHWQVIWSDLHFWKPLCIHCGQWIGGGQKWICGASCSNVTSKWLELGSDWWGLERLRLKKC